MTKRSGSSSDKGTPDEGGQDAEQVIEQARAEIDAGEDGNPTHVNKGFTDEVEVGDVKPTGEVITESTVEGVEQAARNANLT